MTDFSAGPIAPLTKLPIRKFEHFRVITRDSPPVRLVHPLDKSTTEKKHDTLVKVAAACRVCTIHESRYTCPRCEMPYCSVACYREHNTSSGSACTEGFYHDRVHGVLQLEQKAKKHDTLKLLHRHYSQQHVQLDEHSLLTDDPTNAIFNSDMDATGEDEEDVKKLLELLDLLEKPEDTPNHDRHLAHLLANSPNLKAAFEASLQRGDLQQLVLQPWHPWWKPVMSSSTNADNSLDQATASSTLDERLFEIKPLNKILPKGKPIPDLTYNLVELIYCAAYTLRLYHGVSNAISDDETAREAAMTIIQASSVLNQDARYSCLEQVMMQITQSKRFVITTTATQQETHGDDDGTTAGGDPTWMIIARDVADIVGNRRMTGRVLLEILDILKAAITLIKKRSKPQQSSVDPTSTDHVVDNELLSDFRRKRKKVDFFLSWSQHPAATGMIPEQLPNDIRAWVDHWKPVQQTGTYTTSQGKSSNALDELVSVATTTRNKLIALTSPVRGSNNPKAKLTEIMD